MASHKNTLTGGQLCIAHIRAREGARLHGWTIPAIVHQRLKQLWSDCQSCGHAKRALETQQVWSIYDRLSLHDTNTHFGTWPLLPTPNYNPVRLVCICFPSNRCRASAAPTLKEIIDTIWAWFQNMLSVLEQGPHKHSWLALEGRGGDEPLGPHALLLRLPAAARNVTCNYRKQRAMITSQVSVGAKTLAKVAACHSDKSQSAAF